MSENNIRQIAVKWVGGYSTEIKVRDHMIKGDEPTSVGGADTGPMPTEFLLSGVATCMTVALAHFAKVQKLDLGTLEVTASGEKHEVEARFDKINVDVSADLPPDQLDKLLKFAKKYCVVGNTVSNGCDINYITHSITA